MISHLCACRLTPQAFRHTDPWYYHAVKLTAEVPPVLDDVIDRLDEAGFPPRDRFAVRLGLEEALVNAIQHGHRGDPKKTVLLRFCVEATFFIAQVEDEGPGFHPEEVPDPREDADPVPGGRGLLLMKHYMTSVEFNATGNCVTLCKHRSPASEK